MAKVQVPDKLAGMFMQRVARHAEAMPYSDLLRCVNPALSVCGPQYVSADLVAVLDRKLQQLQDPEFQSVAIFVSTALLTQYLPEPHVVRMLLTAVQGQLSKATLVDLVNFLTLADKVQVQPSNEWLEACAAALESGDEQLDAKLVAPLLEQLAVIHEQRKQGVLKQNAGHHQMVILVKGALKRVYAQAADSTCQLSAGHLARVLSSLCRLEIYGMLVKDTLHFVAEAVRAAGAKSTLGEQADLLRHMELLTDSMRLLRQKGVDTAGSSGREGITDAATAGLLIGRALEGYLSQRMPLLNADELVDCCAFMHCVEYAPSQQLQKSLFSALKPSVDSLHARKVGPLSICPWCAPHDSVSLT